MRRFLDRLYLVSGWLAAISMVLMTVLVVVQIVARLFNFQPQPMLASTGSEVERQAVKVEF